MVRTGSQVTRVSGFIITGSETIQSQPCSGHPDGGVDSLCAEGPKLGSSIESGLKVSSVNGKCCVICLKSHLLKLTSF